MSGARPSLVLEVPEQPTLEVRLDADLVSVGRSEDNTLGLRDMNVSRRHFVIERRGGLGWVLRDAGSRNGTLVNGVSVIDKVLLEGDRIEVGGSRLTFRAAASAAAVALAAAPKPTGSGAGLQPPGSGALHRPAGAPAASAGGGPAAGAVTPAPTGPRPVPLPGGPFGGPSARPPTMGFDPPTQVHAARQAALAPGGAGKTAVGGRAPRARDDAHQARWRKLAEVACAINVEHDLDRLLERILDAVLGLVPSQAGALVLREGDELVVKATRNAPSARLEDDASGSPERISRQICREALSQRRPVLTQDAVGDQHLGQFKTVMNLRLKSILCVPFSSQDEALGVVYLDEPTIDLFGDHGELVELVGAFGELAGIALANARLLLEVGQRERMQEELRIAARIQGNLLPREAPAARGLELAGRTLPAREVGGDLYDFFRREDPQPEVLVTIGDVAGKGVGAGILMSTVRALLRAYAEAHGPTDELLVRVNRALARDLEAGMFVSFLVIRYDETTGRLSFTGAGHEHLILYRPSTGQLENVRAGGVVLGLMPDLAGRLVERHMTLQPGDVVCLYTDGASEAPSATGEEFGLERIGAAVRDGPTEPAAIVERVIAAVQAFTGGGEPHDDLTVVALRKTR